MYYKSYLYFQGTVHLWEHEGSDNIAICHGISSDAFLRGRTTGTSSEAATASPIMAASGTSDDAVLYHD